jgi:hypothetical protein
LLTNPSIGRCLVTRASHDWLAQTLGLAEFQTEIVAMAGHVGRTEDEDL